MVRMHAPVTVAGTGDAHRVARHPAPDPLPRTVCCSGGGIRSAAYSLGALQRLRENGFGTRPGDTVVGVSGGSYSAAARALAAATAAGGDPPFGPGSAQEQRLRNNTR